VNVIDQYPVQIAWSDEDQGYIATVPDLPGCSAFGESQGEALAEARDAIAAWIEAAVAAGNPVPSPSPARVAPAASGKALLRLPKGLHARLISEAEEEGSSFNTYCIALLAQNSTIAAVRRSISQTLAPVGHSRSTVSAPPTLPLRRRRP
jgi:predicted RNase H-like HicB family nuclease